MGNNQYLLNTDAVIFSKQYEGQQNYGNGTMIITKSNEVLYKFKLLMQQHETQLIKQDLKIRNRMQSEYLVNLKYFEKITQEILCTLNTTINIFYQYYRNSLVNQIELRQQHNAFKSDFTQTQILNVIISMCEAYEFLIQRKLQLPKVDSSKIFIKDSDTYKLLDIAWLDKISGNGTRKDKQNNHIYLNEADLKSEKKISEVNIIFSLGILALEMMSLEHSANFYDIKSRTIRYKLIKDLLKQIKPKYRRIHHLIDCMLFQNVTEPCDLKIIKNFAHNLLRYIRKQSYSYSENELFPSSKTDCTQQQIIKTHSEVSTPIKKIIHDQSESTSIMMDGPSSSHKTPFRKKENKYSITKNKRKSRFSQLGQIEFQPPNKSNVQRYSSTIHSEYYR